MLLPLVLLFDGSLKDFFNVKGSIQARMNGIFYDLYGGVKKGKFLAGFLASAQ